MPRQKLIVRYYLQGSSTICSFVRSCAAGSNGIFKIMLIDLSETKLDMIQQAILNLDLPGINVQQSDASHLEITVTLRKKPSVSHTLLLANNYASGNSCFW